MICSHKFVVCNGDNCLKISSTVSLLAAGFLSKGHLDLGLDEFLVIANAKER